MAITDKLWDALTTVIKVNYPTLKERGFSRLRFSFGALLPALDRR